MNDKELEPVVADHLEKDEEILCGFCGKPFSSHEVRVEKEIYGRKWVFCNEECLADFREASDFADPEHEPSPKEFDEGTEIRVNITGPKVDDD